MKVQYLVLMLSALLLTACGVGTAPQSFEPVVLPEPESPGAQLMKQNCGDCHGVPAPDTHTADHWPGVVHRMNNRRLMKAYDPMNEQQLQILIDYLRRHGAPAAS